MKQAGVYKITNNITKDFYIGSTNNIQRRFIQHRYNGSDKGRKHSNLYNDMRKYGLDNFSFDVLELTDNYRESEQFYIDTLKPTYNATTQSFNSMDRLDVKEKHNKVMNSKEYKDTIRKSRSFTQTEAFKKQASERSKNWWKEHYEEGCRRSKESQSSPEYRQRRHEMAMAYREQNMLNQPNRKTVLMFDKDHKFLMKFPSIAEGTRYLKEHGYPKARTCGISLGIKNGWCRYGHYWECEKSQETIRKK